MLLAVEVCIALDRVYVGLLGAVSEVEERVLREVAMGDGASKVVVRVGHELSDAEGKEKLNGD
jgi:hypothetical protein